MIFNTLRSHALALSGLLWFTAAGSLQAADELVFSTPPTQSPAQTIENFQPLVEYLTQVSGRKITIKPARNFYEYAREMRAGKYDIVFDGPHFIKYRIDKLHHVVLAKQPGDLRFVVVVKKDTSYKTLNDLVTRKVCAPRVPHLGTLTFIELYQNPMRQPDMLPVQGFGPALKCLDDGKAQAAVLRDKFWLNKVQDKADYRVIYTTERKMPARGVTISSRVDADTRQRIASALVNLQGKRYLEKAFSTFGGSRFVLAEQKEYDGLEDLLQIVWGFHI